MAASSAIGMARLDEAQRRRVIALVAAAGPLEAPALLRPFETIAAGPLATELIHSLERSAGLSAIPADRLAKLIESLPDDVRSQAGKLLQGTSTDLESQRRRLEELNDALVDGDAERGRKLFFGAKASCSACHRVGEEGGNIGPNLAGIGDIRTRRDLLEAVAFPSASFARNFEPYRVTTDSGITYSGVINRTTSDALYLVTTERKIVRIARDEIDDDGVAPAQVSIMPQGLDRILLPGELKDLLAYLSSLRGQK
jgi:putative heme-binding domain-containing protein